MRKFYWDIETAPLPLEQLVPVMPEFEAGANLKDPDKIKTAIEAKRQAWIDDAALRATTGRIIAFASAIDDGEPEFHVAPDERVLLDILHDELATAIGCGANCYAWNGHGFDLPFFVQRCAIHGKSAFITFTSMFRGRRSWNESLIDPMQVWVGPGNRSDGANLKAVAWSLGCGAKSGSGKDFAKLLETDPAAAKEYSLNDVRLLRNVVLKMGI